MSRRSRRTLITPLKILILDIFLLPLQYGEELANTLMNPIAISALTYGPGTHQAQHLIDSGASAWADNRAKHYSFGALTNAQAMAELESAMWGWGKYKVIPPYIRTQIRMKLDTLQPGSYRIQELYRRYIWNFIY